MLGQSLDQPADFVLAWTADGCEGEATRSRQTGGTGTALVLADRLGIPIFNLGRPGTPARLTEFLASRGIAWQLEIPSGTQSALFA